MGPRSELQLFSTLIPLGGIIYEEIKSVRERFFLPFEDLKIGIRASVSFSRFTTKCPCIRIICRRQKYRRTILGSILTISIGPLIAHS